MTNGTRRLQIAELAILALTLVVTLVAALGVYWQTRLYYRQERTRYFIERFNRTELVESRRIVDKWFESGESVDELFQRKANNEKDAIDTFEAIRLFANFFQELAVAMKHESMDEKYLWDVFAFLVSDYGTKLKPFIKKQRSERGRPSLYQDIDELMELMAQLEDRYAR